MQQFKPLLLAAMVAGLTGCGGSSSDDNDQGESTTQPPVQYKVSGSIIGLHLDGLELSLDGELISIDAGITSFAFESGIDAGSSYQVTINQEPVYHNCSIENASGSISNDVNNITVNCIDERVGAQMTHLKVGNSLDFDTGENLILSRAAGDTAPEQGKLWLCGVPPDGAGAAETDDWLNADGTWNNIIKPKVSGENYWNSELNITLDANGKRIITGNGLPTTVTGTFPIEAGTLAHEYDRNPSVIGEQEVNLTFDAIPQKSDTPYCTTFGATGISLTGSAIYHGSSTLGNDASTFEVLDSCGGHADGTSTYHYHYLSQCVLDELDPDNGGHSNLMGYIMDGFGIFGPRGEDGEVLTSADLDQCHGHTHEIEWDGEYREMYHYHWTFDFPYNVGCFNNEPQTPWNGRPPE